MSKIIWAMALMLLVSGSGLAEIYKWTDESGNVHYGDRPVDKSETIDIVEKKSAQSSNKVDREQRRRKLLETYDIERKEKKEKQYKERKQKAKMNARCGRAKDRLRRYKKAGSLYDVDKNGNRTTLPDESREAAIENLQKKIKKFCS